MNRLPIGWVEAGLGTLAEARMGKTILSKELVTDGIPVFSASVGAEPWGYVTESDVLFQRGTIVISARGTIGDIKLPQYDQFVSTQTTIAATPAEGVDPEFLAHQLRCVDWPGSTATTAIPMLTISKLNEIPIAISPLAEQRRIVAKIDNLSGKSKRARDHLDHVPRLVEKYKGAVLHAAFKGALNGEKFEQFEAFGELIDSTFYGPRFSKEAYVATGVPTIRTTDFSETGQISLDGTPRVEVSSSDFAKWSLRHGDILVTRTGSIGKCAVYDQRLGPALPSAYLIRVRVDQSRLLPQFAFWRLSSPEGQEHLGVNTTAVTQPNINANAIRSLPIPTCSLEQQRKIVSRIEATFAWIDRLAAEATSARKLVDHLDQAILSKAFRGELVPQDPDDEPASVLLEKIRAEREGTTGGRKRRRVS